MSFSHLGTHSHLQKYLYQNKGSVQGCYIPLRLKFYTMLSVLMLIYIYNIYTYKKKSKFCRCFSCTKYSRWIFRARSIGLFLFLLLTLTFQLNQWTKHFNNSFFFFTFQRIHKFGNIVDTTFLVTSCSAFIEVMITSMSPTFQLIWMLLLRRLIHL